MQRLAPAHLSRMVRCAWWLCLLLAVGCEAPIPEPVVLPEPELPPDAELLASRPFKVLTPDDYDGGTPLPLLVALHGYGSSGGNLDRRMGLSRFASSRGLLLVLANATPDARGNPAWHTFKVPKYPFDREYLRALIEAVIATYPVDRARVFIFGYSQGAHLAHRMGCEEAGLLTGFISLAGQAPTDPGDCLPSQPLSVLQVHGTADQAVGYDGDVQHEPPLPGVPSAHQTIAVWGQADGCGALKATGRTIDLSEEIPGDETTVEAYEACPPGIGVELWTMHDVQHWPSPQPNFLGVLYGFLAVHPRP